MKCERIHVFPSLGVSIPSFFFIAVFRLLRNYRGCGNAARGLFKVLCHNFDAFYWPSTKKDN